MGYADATGALAELADLDELDRAVGAGLSRAQASTTSTRRWSSARWGDRPSRTSAQLRRIERELREQGYLQRDEQGPAS